jgi:hypothetical protein
MRPRPFSTSKAMTTPSPDVYVFVSTNRALYALTVQADGANLPRVEDAAPWVRIDAIPMLSASVMKYARNAEIAMTNLIMRGYHLARITADVRA